MSNRKGRLLIAMSAPLRRVKMKKMELLLIKVNHLFKYSDIAKCNVVTLLKVL